MAQPGDLAPTTTPRCISSTLNVIESGLPETGNRSMLEIPYTFSLAGRLCEDCPKSEHIASGHKAKSTQADRMTFPLQVGKQPSLMIYRAFSRVTAFWRRAESDTTAAANFMMDRFEGIRTRPAMRESRIPFP
jgi:hypothetical protein